MQPREAILLRAVDFGESDRIVHLLTPEVGRLTAIAKGARRSVKRFPGTLDLFNHLEIRIDRRRRRRSTAGMARLERATLISHFEGLRRRPARFALACTLLELLDRLAHEGGNPADARRLFVFARDALRGLESATPDERMRVFLELRTLDALGLRPEFRHCVRCGREPVPERGGRIGFHVADGGVVCDACGVGIDSLMLVHLGTLRTLEQGLRLAPERLDLLSIGAATLSEAEQLVQRFQRFHVGVALRSEPFLERMLQTSAARVPAAGFAQRTGTD